MLYFLLFMFCVSSGTVLMADLEPCRTFKEPHFLGVDPEIYYLSRSRSGGTKQHGAIYGIRASYDYIKRYNFYFGSQAFFGKGILYGKTSGGDKLRSWWTDEQIESYVGYTFQQKKTFKFSFTPYVGGGYMREVNKFTSPSPLQITFNTDFGFFGFGFLSSVTILPEVRIGLNTRFKTPWEPKCRIKGDTEHEEITQNIGLSFQYRIELPINYRLIDVCNFIEIGLMPFYEHREFKGRMAIPFNYPTTIIRMYGLEFLLTFRF